MPCVGHKSWCKVSGLSHSEELEDRGGFILKILSQKETRLYCKVLSKLNFQILNFKVLDLLESKKRVLEPCISPMTLRSRVGIASKVKHLKFRF